MKELIRIVSIIMGIIAIIIIGFYAKTIRDLDNVGFSILLSINFASSITIMTYAICEEENNE